MAQENGNPGYLPQQEEVETINLREIIENYLIYWKWILVSALLFLLIGTVYLMTQEDVYEFKASVLVIDPRGQMGEMAILNELSSVGNFRNFNATNNEERVLKSTHLMKRVVKSLRLYISYYNKTRLSKKELYTDTPCNVSIDSISLYRLKSIVDLKIKYRNGSYQLSGTYLKEDFEFELKQFPATIPTPAGELTIEWNSGFADFSNFSQKEIHIKIAHPDRVAISLANNGISTSVDKTSDEIWLSYKAQHIRKGKDVLNELVRIYNRDAVEQITQSAQYSGLFIDSRLVLLEEELTDVEQRIENYKQINELTNIDSDAAMFLESNSQYYDQQIANEIQMQLIDYVAEYVRTSANRYSLIPDPGLADQGLVSVIKEYNDLLIMRDKMMQGTSDSNPAMITLNRQIDNLHASIRSGITSVKQSLQIKQRELVDQNLILKSRLKDIPRQEREFVEIKRQQQVKEALYLFLLQKREEASLSKAIATNKARLLNAPDSPNQVAPRSIVIIFIFFVLGLLVPISFIFVKGLLNTTIVNRTDIEKLTRIPILAELAHNKLQNAIFDHNSNSVTNAELFRLLRAKLQFVLNSPKEKVILVTSTQPGEGKTFVSLNLAISLSLLDKKVLLVGLDLRKPTITKYFGAKNLEGVTSYLSGQTNDINSLIFQQKEYPNLKVLPAGIIPPNPNELIIKQRFDELFEELRRDFDYIVLDTAPVGAVSDTYLVDRVADICLYVTRSEYSDKRNIEFINRLNSEETLKRIFILINDVKFESNKYTYYRRYGYGYGYGYGSEKNS